MDTKEAHGVFPLDQCFICYVPQSHPPAHTSRFFKWGDILIFLFFFSKQHPWRLCVKWTALLSFWLFCDRPVVRETHQMTHRFFSPMACLKSQINTGPYALNEMSRSFMTCVKKLVSCSLVKRQIYCHKGTLGLTVMGKAVVATEWWICLDKNTPEV